MQGTPYTLALTVYQSRLGGLSFTSTVDTADKLTLVAQSRAMAQYGCAQGRGCSSGWMWVCIEVWKWRWASARARIQFSLELLRDRTVVIGGQWSVVSGQWSVVSGQWSVVSGQWSVVTNMITHAG